MKDDLQEAMGFHPSRATDQRSGHYTVIEDPPGRSEWQLSVTPGLRFAAPKGFTPSWLARVMARFLLGWKWEKISRL